MLIVCIIASLLAALPPLSDDGRTQLDTATDFGPANDEAALYPLLENALLWPPAMNRARSCPITPPCSNTRPPIAATCFSSKATSPADLASCPLPGPEIGATR